MQNKREFDERARENNYDLLYKNECQNWRNKINKAKKTDGFPEERLKEMKDTFEILKKEALQRKKLIRTGERSTKEFMDWLYQQNSIIAKLTDIDFTPEAKAKWLHKKSKLEDAHSLMTQTLVEHYYSQRQRSYFAKYGHSQHRTA